MYKVNEKDEKKMIRERHDLISHPAQEKRTPNVIQHSGHPIGQPITCQASCPRKEHQTPFNIADIQSGSPFPLDGNLPKKETPNVIQHSGHPIGQPFPTR